MKLFSGCSNPSLAQSIAQKLKLKVSPFEITVFPDGERRVRVIDRVVDEHCLLVQPTNPPADQNYMELFFAIDALKRSGAEFVTAVVPYLGYQRQDHVFQDGEAVSLEVIAKTLVSTGLDRLICFDLHSVKIPEVFTIPVAHLSALGLFASVIRHSGEYSPSGENDARILSGFREGSWTSQDDIILVSPDMGGIARIKKLSELLGGMPWAAIEKDRDLKSGNVSSRSFGEGTVKGKKTAFLVDDMISSGKTISVAAEFLKKSGVEQIYVFSTHAIFSKDAPVLLQNSSVELVFVTDSVCIPEEKKFPKLKIISIADIIAKHAFTQSYSKSDYFF